MVHCAPAEQTHAAVPVVSSAAPSSPKELDASALDAMLEDAWKKNGLTPAAKLDDGRWLRRVTLDVAGTLPTAEKVRAFLADPRPDKRARAVDELLTSRAYAEHWAFYWDSELVGRTRAGDLDRFLLRAWLAAQFERNVAWNDLVKALLTATGQNSDGVRKKTLDDATPALDTAGVNPAVNYVLAYRDTPQDFAGNVSRTFLGVQIQCAQCHDHKTEPWKQTDFQKFAACFARTQVVAVDKMDPGIKRVEVKDLDKPAPRFGKDEVVAPIAKAPPTTLDGTALDGNVRQGVAAWITKNPGFARAIVNRMWAHFLGRGFTNPVDDVRPSNPPLAPEIEDALAKDFVDHKYDLKRLIRLVTSTEAYALAPGKPPEGGKPDYWSRFRMSPLGPEELVNAILVATGADQSLARRGGGGGGTLDVDEVKERLARQFSVSFDVDETVDAPSYEGTLTQALTLLNGKLVTTASSSLPGTKLHALVDNASLDDGARIETLFLSAYARRPRADELATWTKLLETAPVNTAPIPGKPGKRPIPPRVQALEDLLWTLLNSSEFLFNH